MGRSVAAVALLSLLFSRRWAFCSIAARALALCCCSCRKGLSLCSRSSREGFSFLLPELKKRNKENSPSPLFCLLWHLSPLNKKNSLTLKQLFVFHAPKSTSASRQKSEAGPYCFFRNIATLVGCGCFEILHYTSFRSGLQKRKLAALCYRDPSLRFAWLWMKKK